MVEGAIDGASDGSTDGTLVEGDMVEGVTDGAIACTVHTPNRYNNLINTIQ